MKKICYCTCRFAIQNNKNQQGQALTESILSILVIGSLLLGSQHLWRYGEARQKASDVTRFAAWERTAWEPEENQVEKHALHQSNHNLAINTVMHQLLKPAAWREFRQKISSDGLATSPNEDASSAAQRRKQLMHDSLKTFTTEQTDPNNMVQIETKSGWTNSVERAFRGMDPTGGVLTSLELDRDTYRTVSTSMTSPLITNANWLNGLFNFNLSPLAHKRKLSLITNAWAAPPPLMLIRSERQLNPISYGDSNSGTAANPLAYFGLKNSSSTVSAADFIGMVPWWNLIAGPNGFTGQQIVRKIGLDAAGANGLAQSSGQNWSFDATEPAKYLLLKAQTQQNEFFDADTGRGATSGHRHMFVIDESAEARAAKDGSYAARDSNSEKRKYKAVSLQNPVEVYYQRP